MSIYRNYCYHASSVSDITKVIKLVQDANGKVTRIMLVPKSFVYFTVSDEEADRVCNELGFTPQQLLTEQ